MAGNKYRNDITNIIYKLESSEGTNKKAYIPNKYKALGGFQLTPGAFTELQKLVPERWAGKSFSTVAKDDKQAREAASDYLFILERQLRAKRVPITNENLLLAYHSGVGNVSRGTIGPYGRDYAARARALAGAQPGEVW